GAGGDRVGKWIEIADNEVDRRYPALSERGHVIRLIAARQNARMDRRMQGLDPAVEHFGKTGNFRYFGDRQPGLGEKSRRAGARDQRDAARGERPGESDDPGLIGNGNEGATDRLRSRDHSGGV